VAPTGHPRHSRAHQPGRAVRHDPAVPDVLIDLWRGAELTPHVDCQDADGCAADGCTDGAEVNVDRVARGAFHPNVPNVHVELNRRSLLVPCEALRGLPKSQRFKSPRLRPPLPLRAPSVARLPVALPCPAFLSAPWPLSLLSLRQRLGRERQGQESERRLGGEDRIRNRLLRLCRIHRGAS